MPIQEVSRNLHFINRGNFLGLWQDSILIEPKIPTWVFIKVDFSTLTFRFASSSWLTIVSKLRKFSSSVFPMKDFKTSSIIYWKIAGESLRPKSSLINSHFLLD